MIKGQLNVLPTIDGSALLTDHQTKTQILVAIHGPINQSENKILSKKMTIEILFVKENQAEYDAIFAKSQLENEIDPELENDENSLDPISTENGIHTSEKNLTTSNPVNLEENLISRRIKELVSQIVDLQFLPRAMLRINIQVLQDCGNLMSNTLNCVVLALLDTGINMITTPIAVQNSEKLIKIEEGKDKDVEPDQKRIRLEPEGEDYLIIFDQANNFESIIATYLQGDCDAEKYEDIKKRALQTIEDCGLRSLYQDALRVKMNYN